MKILVTGATGFLGSAMCRALVQGGQEVRALARKTSDLSRLNGLPVEVRYVSLEDSSNLVDLFDGIGYVYHCAALVSDWGPWSSFYEANVKGVRNLLEAAQGSRNLQRFVHISTTDVYGYPVEAVDETYPITDIGLPYNRSKGLGEKAVWDAYRRTGMPVSVVRPATIYGPRSMSIVVEIAALLKKKRMAWIDEGKLPAGLLYIDNAVEGIIQAAHSPRTVGQAYNLRDEGNETWRQFMTALAIGMKVEPPRTNLPSGLVMAMASLLETIYRMIGIRNRPLATRHSTYMFCRSQGYSIEKARRDFGFRSRVSFDEGMERTIAWLASEEGRKALSAKLR